MIVSIEFGRILRARREAERILRAARTELILFGKLNADQARLVCFLAGRPDDVVGSIFDRGALKKLNMEELIRAAESRLTRGQISGDWEEEMKKLLTNTCVVRYGRLRLV